MWISPGIFAPPLEMDVREVGHPCADSDALLQILFCLKRAFYPPPHALQAFVLGVRKLAARTLPGLRYMTLGYQAQAEEVVVHLRQVKSLCVK
jgi:hypothetical protein